MTDLTEELQRLRDKTWTRLTLDTSALENPDKIKVRLWAGSDGDSIYFHVGCLPINIELSLAPQAAYDFAQAILDARLEANRIAEIIALQRSASEAAANDAAERDVDQGRCLCHDADVCPDLLSEAQADEERGA